MDAQVVGDDGEVLPPGQVGELWLRGPNVVRGYWQRPEETAAAFAPDGWIRTGDLVTIDGEGMVTVVDRRKEIIMRGGENIAPAEVEAALLDHGSVLDAAVVGVPHPLLGEEVMALVQVATIGDGLDEELRRHVAQRLAAFKVPVRIELVDVPLPRNPQGKLLRAQVRAELARSPGS
jgi:long-chain acyl-CoA synthetase